MGILETLKPATHTPVYSKEDGALGPACGDIPAGPVILRTKGLIYDLMEGFLSRMNTDPWAEATGIPPLWGSLHCEQVRLSQSTSKSSLGVHGA